jgi:hypothetical protein
MLPTRWFTGKSLTLLAAYPGCYYRVMLLATCLTVLFRAAYKLERKRGELRRLAATQNKRLNSTGKPGRRSRKNFSFVEVPRCLARDFFFGLGSLVFGLGLF